MENKLQELTKRLYDEGLSKGRQEAGTLVSDAQAKAKKIIADAEAEAARIKTNAEKSAEDLRKNTLTELNMAGKQVISTLKSEISNMLICKTAGEPVSQAALDPAFIRDVLTEVAKNWQGSSFDKVSLRAMLPASKEKELSKELGASIRKALGDGMEIVFSDGIKSGFRIGPKDGGYYIDFSEESFFALFKEYLRPKVSEMLYGNKE